MPRYIALLRGVNIGAKKRIAMADLRALVEDLGHTDVATYVNSGNVVFTAAGPWNDTGLAHNIEAALMGVHSLDVPVVVRSGEELAGIIANNPFPQYVNEPKTLHVSFLSDDPAPDLIHALDEIERGEDEFRVLGKEIYLHYPHGLSGGIFMLNGFDKALAVTSTSRNWRTVLKLADTSGTAP